MIVLGILKANLSLLITVDTIAHNGQVLAEVAELAAQQYLMKNKCSQIIHQPSNERQAAILANTLLGTVRLFYERNQN